MKRSCLIIALMLAVATGSLANNLLTNSSFENPTGLNTWDNSGWTNSWGLRENWYPREGARSGMFWSWDDNTNGWVYQDVPVTTGGTFVAGMWIRLETNLPSVNTARMTLAWFDASTNSVAVSNEATYSSVPTDGKWHHIHVKGTCTSPNLAIVRVRFDASWGASPLGDQVTYYYDNAELVRENDRVLIGSEVPVWNGGFSEGNADPWNAFWLSQWDYAYVGLEEGCRREATWYGQAGGFGVLVFEGYQTNQPRYSTEVSQRVVPLSLGTNTLSFWANRESGFLLTNGQVRIEWYDASFTNKVKADDAMNMTAITPDGQWREYSITAVCTNTSLHEARIVFFAQFDSNPTTAVSRSLLIDNVRFLPGTDSDVTNAMLTDWCYHNNIHYNAQQEQVPGTNVGPFMQISYGTTSVTFYVLAESPSQAKYYPVENNRWELRTSYQDPGNSFIWTNNFMDFTRLGDVVIPSGTPFHGLPAAGSKTASLWRAVWPMPRDIGGARYTNHIPVYYAPFTKTTNGVVESSYNYLLAWNTGLTNNLGQEMGHTPENHDYFFDLNPTVVAAFTNGGFEEPLNPLVTNLDNTAWTGIGGTSRDTWAAKFGKFGALFQAWSANHSILYQDVSVTGGMYAFSTWVQIQTGATVAAGSLSMQWFNKDGRMVQENKKNFAEVPRGGWWNRAIVMGGCNATNLDHVRLSIEGFYGSELGSFNSAFIFDNAEFAPIQGYGMVNTGFETGADGDLVNWYGYTTYEHNWGGWPHSGTQFAGFHGWETTQPTYESFLSQPMMASTGQYTLSVWLKRETDFHLSNALLKIEWYDGTLTNKVQADTTATLTVPNDTTWYLYSVTGICLNPSLRVIVPGVQVQWGRFGSGFQTMGADDFGLLFTNAAGTGFTDGIPDSWWDLYSIPLGSRQGTNDYDNDGFSNLEEYTGDTIPSNINSFFSRATNSVTGNRAVMYLIVNPSSAARNYDAWWKTNLMESSAWQRTGQSVPGNGGLIQIGVTNDLGKRYYRTGAIVP